MNLETNTEVNNSFNDFKRKVRGTSKKIEEIMGGLFSTINLLEFKSLFLSELCALKVSFSEFKNALAKKDDPDIQDLLALLNDWEKSLYESTMQQIKNLFIKEYAELADFYMSLDFDPHKPFCSKSGLSEDDLLNIKIILETSSSVDDFLGKI